jgi:hypothetical protein
LSEATGVAGRDDGLVAKQRTIGLFPAIVTGVHRASE